MADSKVWFITGCSKGFGRIWAEAALERGDKVAATARDASTLDAAGREVRRRRAGAGARRPGHDADFAAVQQAHEKFGRLDVVVNNAGYGLFGAVEEVSEEQARDQIETNLFGALWVTQAALPIMREQGSGHIIQVSSIGGVTAFPGVGLYHASKWALEAFSQSLRRRSPTSASRSRWSSRRASRPTGAARRRPRRADARLRGDARSNAETRRGAADAGDPEATGPAILKLVDAEEPPLRCFFGANAFDIVRPDYESRIANWEEWDWLAKEAHGEASPRPARSQLSAASAGNCERIGGAASRSRPPAPRRLPPSPLCWDGPGRRVRPGSAVRPSGSRSTCRRRDRRSPRTS